VGNGNNVEVVNAGVEGYYSRQVLERIEEFKALQPENSANRIARLPRQCWRNARIDTLSSPQPSRVFP